MTVCPAAINIRARSLILHYSTCTAGDNSPHPVPVHVIVSHFLQLQVARPPPEPYPIRNYKLCRLAAMHIIAVTLDRGQRVVA